MVRDVKEGRKKDARVGWEAKGADSWPTPLTRRLPLSQSEVSNAKKRGDEKFWR